MVINIKLELNYKLQWLSKKLSWMQNKDIQKFSNHQIDKSLYSQCK